MTNLMNLELNNMTAEELRSVARELEMTGAWKSKKQEMVDFIQAKVDTLKADQEVQEAILNQPKPSSSSAPKRGRRRKIEVYKDGELIETIDGLLNTFKWASENEITNQGWVKRSLKNNEVTKAGWKFKNGGGYLFKYAVIDELEK